MRFAISIPQFFDDGEFDPAAQRAYLRRAEELGFESAWTQEKVLGPTPQLSPLESMTFAAACTERLRLGCVVFVLPLHNPIHLAKSISSLDQLSGGRVEVGIGIGGRNRLLSAFGVHHDRLVTQFNEGLRLMKALWTEPETNFDGEFWQLTGARMEPKPAQKPHPPVWFGARHPNAVRRAVRHGYGFFGAGSSTTAEFVEQVRVVREELAAQGRQPSEFPIAKRVYVDVDDNPDRAARRMADGLIRIYGEHGRELEPVAVTGPPEACVRGLREVADAGAELILLTTVENQAEQMERLSAEVIPHLRDT